MRRPLFGRHGGLVVAGLCGYELAALCPRSPFPPLTRIVHRYPPVGFLLVAVLAHHLLLERTT